MAPTCAPGHSDLSQDLPNQAGRDNNRMGAQGGCQGEESRTPHR